MRVATRKAPLVERDEAPGGHGGGRRERPEQVREQLAGRVLGEATFSGTYTLNQRLLAAGD